MTFASNARSTYLFRISAVALAIFSIAACEKAPTAPNATVYFSFNAPLCSSVVPLEFLIDGAGVGMDTLAVNYAASGHPSISRGFVVAPGEHTLGALFEGPASAGHPTFADVTVTLGQGQAFTDSLPMYCS